MIDIRKERQNHAQDRTKRRFCGHCQEAGCCDGGNTELLTSNFTDDLRDFYDRQGQYRKLRPLDPTVTFDEDQMEMLNLWGTPMTDTVNAWTCKFAMNQADINNDWDTYVAEVEAQNMQNIVDMYNDTYNANK